MSGRPVLYCLVDNRDRGTRGDSGPSKPAADIGRPLEDLVERFLRQGLEPEDIARQLRRFDVTAFEARRLSEVAQRARQEAVSLGVGDTGATLRMVRAIKRVRPGMSAAQALAVLRRLDTEIKPR